MGSVRVALDPNTTPRFVRWIDETGVETIAKALGVGVRVIYAWRAKALGNHGYRPNPDKLGEILTLAAGRLTSADVYPPRPKVPARKRGSVGR